MRRWSVESVLVCCVAALILGCAGPGAQSPGLTGSTMTSAEARAMIAELQAERGFKPIKSRPVQSTEELLDIVVRDDLPRFEDCTRFLEGKNGIDALTLSATVELLWSDAFGAIALVAREFGDRAEAEVARVEEKKRAGREFTEQEAKKLEQAKHGADFYAKAEMSLGVLARDHLATGSELAREATQRYPDDPRTLRVAAFYYLATGMWGRYDATMQSLSDSEASDAGLLFLRALEALKRNERPEEARRFLQAALSVNPRLVRAQARLVLIQDDVASSHAELVKLQAVAPEHPIVRITGPTINDEYVLAQSFARARGATAPATAAPAPPPAP